MGLKVIGESGFGCVAVASISRSCGDWDRAKDPLYLRYTEYERSERRPQGFGGCLSSSCNWDRGSSHTSITSSLLNADINVSSASRKKNEMCHD